MLRRPRLSRILLLGLLLAGILVPPLRTPPAGASALRSSFQEQIVFTGLTAPSNVEFSPDGRVFVAERRGIIKVFDDLADTTPTIFADLSANVHNQWDRGLLGLALAPNFPANPWVYVLYTYDAPPGRAAPYWHDVCPDPNNGSCVVTSRLSKLQASGDVMVGAEQVLIHDWCQQYPSHSVGDLKFGQDGMLYATAGDGANFNNVDYGQLGGPPNPCGDPPGDAMNPPTAEGGALRAQDARSTSDPTQLDGAMLRLDPVTGAAAPGNPFSASADPNQRRIVAYGLRNPFRFTVRPGTNELWVSDVGWNTNEDIERITNVTAPGGTNLGWPCFEGPARSSYDSANLNLCESLYAVGGQKAPFFSYRHDEKIVADEPCPSGSSSVAGLAFYPSSGGSYPTRYNGTLFFSDFSRDCIWAMRPPVRGQLPNPAVTETFVAGAADPVDLAIGPGGELYYVDIGGTVRRIRYFPGNQPPTAALGAVPTSGSAPLTVSFNATGSTDPDPADAGRLTYAWDFTDNGSTDATGPTASFTYAAEGTYTARLTVTDTLGASASATVRISSGNAGPIAVVDAPAAGTTWAVGDTISFAGHATDPQQGTLPATALDWRLRLRHCSTLDNCHTHYLQEWHGVASGSFIAPDHEYPSYLELEFVATDAQGLTSNVVRRLDPKTVNVGFDTKPSGLQLTVGATTQTAPFTRTVIQGSTVTLSAPTPQVSGVNSYAFTGWSDGGAQTHVATATGAVTYMASYSTGVASCLDAFGYTCTDGPRTFVPADTEIGLNGDDVSKQVALPFPLKLYGQAYSTAWVDTNGLLSFQPLPSNPSAWEQSPIPSPAEPSKANLAVYPFWADLDVDGQARVLSTVVGTAPNRSYVVEWRNVTSYGDPTARLTFEVILGEQGAITFAYRDIDGNPIEQGAQSTVGIENGNGTIAVQYAYRQPVLRSGNGVTFVPPA